METQHGTDPNTDKRSQQHTLDQQSSGLSIAAYCREHTLTTNNFYTWRRKLDRTDNPSSPRRFVPVTHAVPSALAEVYPASSISRVTANAPQSKRGRYRSACDVSKQEQRIAVGAWHRHLAGNPGLPVNLCFRCHTSDRRKECLNALAVRTYVKVGLAGFEPTTSCTPSKQQVQKMLTNTVPLQDRQVGCSAGCTSNAPSTDLSRLIVELSSLPPEQRAAIAKLIYPELRELS